MLNISFLIQFFTFYSLRCPSYSSLSSNIWNHHWIISCWSKWSTFWSTKPHHRDISYFFRESVPRHRERGEPSCYILIQHCNSEFYLTFLNSQMAPPGLCQSYKLNCDLSEPGNDFPISDLTGFPANKLTPHSNYHKYKYVSNCCNNPITLPLLS